MGGMTGTSHAGSAITFLGVLLILEERGSFWDPQFLLPGRILRVTKKLGGGGLFNRRYAKQGSRSKRWECHYFLEVVLFFFSRGNGGRFLGSLKFLPPRKLPFQAGRPKSEG